jgi:DnaJ-domain-containing protein 1
MTLTSFENQLNQSQNKTGTCILLLLCWVAAADGRIDKEEAKELNRIATASNIPAPNKLLQIATLPDLSAIQLACEILKRHAPREQADLMMQLCLGMAMADGTLTVSENNVIRFIADVFSIPLQRLQALFESLTGKPLPKPSDVSKASWWNRAKDSQQDNSGFTKGATSLTPEIIAAYGVLGLEPGAMAPEVKTAYRRMAKIHHPDRYSELGVEAVEAATATFKRINAAYQLITSL